MVLIIDGWFLRICDLLFQTKVYARNWRTLAHRLFLEQKRLTRQIRSRYITKT